jgi:hypothetical protein
MLFEAARAVRAYDGLRASEMTYSRGLPVSRFPLPASDKILLPGWGSAAPAILRFEVELTGFNIRGGNALA